MESTILPMAKPSPQDQRVHRHGQACHLTGETARLEEDLVIGRGEVVANRQHQAVGVDLGAEWVDVVKATTSGPSMKITPAIRIRWSKNLVRYMALSSTVMDAAFDEAELDHGQHQNDQHQDDRLGEDEPRSLPRKPSR